METNREKFNKLVTSINTEIFKEVDNRISNRDWLRRSNRIAAKVLVTLKEQKMTQKDLAVKMNVTPQYINKLVKGGENLTIETITKLEKILNISFFSDPIRKRNTNDSTAYTGTFNGSDYTYATHNFYNDII